MHHARTAARGLVLVFVVLSTALPQNLSTKRAYDVEAQRTAPKSSEPGDPRQKILSVLEQQLEAQKSFVDESLRISIQSVIADMLWTFDEVRARRLLREAFNAMANVAASERRGSSALPYTLRNVVIRTITSRDPAMALELQQSLEIPSNIDPKLTRMGSEQSNLYSQRAAIQHDLAVQILLSEARTGEYHNALRAIKPFIDRGDLQRVIQYAIQIRIKDIAAADEIFVQALSKARLGQPDLEDIRQLSGYVFPFFGLGVFRYSQKGDPFESSISGELRSQLLELALNTATARLDAALAGKDGSNLNPRAWLEFATPTVLAAYFDKFLPDRAPAFRARLQELTRRVPPEDQPYLAVSSPGIDDLLALADKLTDVQAKDFLYQNAATRAKATGDLEKTASIIEKISNEGWRTSQKNALQGEIDNRRVQEIYNAIGARDLDKAESLLAGVKDDRLRIQVFSGLIAQLNLKDRGRATSLVEEFEQRVLRNEDLITRALQLKALALTTTRIDRTRGLEKMEQAIEAFNSAGLTPEWERSLDSQRAFYQKTQVGLVLLLDDRDFWSLGQLDLDRALALASKFQLKEASALAQLAVCRGMLSKLQPERPPLSEREKDSERKALAIVEKISEMSKSFEDITIQIRVQAQIADLLWTRDEAGARRMFEKAFEKTAAAPLPAIDSSVPPSYVGADSHYPLRNDLIRLVAQRDPALAARLIDSVEDQPPNVDPKFIDGAYGKYSEQDMLRFQFAMYILHSAPQRAVEIARALLQKGDMRRAVSIADELRRNDPSLGDDLFSRALSWVKKASPYSQENIRLLAGYVFPGFGVVIRSANGSRPAPPEIGATLKGQFLELALNAALHWTEALERNSTSGTLEPERDPALATARQLLVHFEKLTSKDVQIVRDRLESVRGLERQTPGGMPETAEGLVAIAEKTSNTDQRNRLYYQAAMRAMQAGQSEQVHALLSKIDDDRLRSQIEIDQRRAKGQELQVTSQRAIEAGDFDTAYQLITEVPERDQRLVLLSNLMVSLLNRKEFARAPKLLTEIEQLSGKGDNAIERAQELVRLSELAPRIDPERGFAAARLAVEALNLSGISPVWDKVETLTGPNNMIRSRRQVGLQVLFATLTNAPFGQLARVDFDRMMQLAQSVELKEASALLQLSVCRAVLR